MNLRAHAITAIGRQQPSLIRYVQPQDRPEDKPVRQQVVEEFGFVPAPVLIHSCVEGLFAGSWMLLRETTLAGAVPRAVKEALSLVVSRMNRCPFCEDSHAMALDGMRMPKLALAIASDDWSRISNSDLVRILMWAKQNANPYERNTPLPSVPFRVEDAPELIGTVVLFHYLNRIVNVFLEESPLPRPFRAQAWKRLWQWLGGRTFERIFTRPLMPGRSLQFLPGSALPSDLVWAAGNSYVSGAFSRFDRVLETGAQAMLSSDTRKIVKDRLARWRGERPPLDKEWIREAVLPLREEDRPLARIALLATFAPYAVTPQEIEDARSCGADNTDLVVTVAWAAFAAARRVGSWMNW